MASPMQIIITGGGTGGHLFPALAIGDEIMERHPNAKVYYVGSTFGIEKDVLPVKNVAHSLLPIRGLQRSLNFSAMGKNLLLPGRLLSSISKVKSLLNEINPNLVIGTGGYASALPLREGIRRGIPTLIQEQNSYPGVTTRWFAEKANRVCIAFEEAQSFIKKKCVLAGNPVRKEINMGDRLQGLSQYGFNDKKNTLFLFGMPGGWEWVLIILLVLVFFGAKKIPELARGLGRGIREFKDATREIKKDIDKAGEIEEEPK